MNSMTYLTGFEAFLRNVGLSIQFHTLPGDEQSILITCFLCKVRSNLGEVRGLPSLYWLEAKEKAGVRLTDLRRMHNRYMKNKIYDLFQQV